MYRVRGDPRKRRLTLDHYPALTLADARQRAQEVLLAASRGQDPAADKQAHNNSATFADSPTPISTSTPGRRNDPGPKTAA